MSCEKAFSCLGHFLSNLGAVQRDDTLLMHILPLCERHVTLRLRALFVNPNSTCQIGTETPPKTCIRAFKTTTFQIFFPRMALPILEAEPRFPADILRQKCSSDVIRNVVSEDHVEQTKMKIPLRQTSETTSHLCISYAATLHPIDETRDELPFTGVRWSPASSLPSLETLPA